MRKYCQKMETKVSFDSMFFQFQLFLSLSISVKCKNQVKDFGVVWLLHLRHLRQMEKLTDGQTDSKTDQQHPPDEISLPFSLGLPQTRYMDFLDSRVEIIAIFLHFKVIQRR